ncbi:hypothetical protein JCM8547_000159 [Rhodosporidiobolus lusitaniae]
MARKLAEKQRALEYLSKASAVDASDADFENLDAFLETGCLSRLTSLAVDYHTTSLWSLPRLKELRATLFESDDFRLPALSPPAFTTLSLVRSRRNEDVPPLRVAQSTIHFFTSQSTSTLTSLTVHYPFNLLQTFPETTWPAVTDVTLDIHEGEWWHRAWAAPLPSLFPALLSLSFFSHPVSSFHASLPPPAPSVDYTLLAALPPTLIRLSLNYRDCDSNHVPGFPLSSLTFFLLRRSTFAPSLRFLDFVGTLLRDEDDEEPFLKAGRATGVEVRVRWRTWEPCRQKHDQEAMAATSKGSSPRPSAPTAPRLPAELFDLILSSPSLTGHDLQRLSLVSRHFCHVVRPTLWSTFTYELAHVMAPLVRTIKLVQTACDLVGDEEWEDWWDYLHLDQTPPVKPPTSHDSDDESDPEFEQDEPWGDWASDNPHKLTLTCDQWLRRALERLSSVSRTSPQSTPRASIPTTSPRLPPRVVSHASPPLL